jgi:hypothetical protein
MKSPLILLFTRDGDFAQSVRDVLFETGATVLIARDVRGGLQIVWQRGRELDSALMDFDDGCRAGHCSARSTIVMNGCPLL